MQVKRFKADGTNGIMLSVSMKEALQLIQSLSSQIIGGGPNMNGRLESYAEDGTYVSVSVNPDLDPTVSSSSIDDEETKLHI